MKNLFCVYLLACSFVGMNFFVQATKGQQSSFCSKCGTSIRADFVSIYKPNGQIDRLVCKKCSRMMKAKNDTTSSSPSASLFSLGSDNVFDSPLSPISPLSPTSSLSMSSLAECFSPFFVNYKSKKF